MNPAILSLSQATYKSQLFHVCFAVNRLQAQQLDTAGRTSASTAASVFSGLNDFNAAMR